MFYKITGSISIVGSLLFFLIFLVLGFIQPGYNHLHHTISMLVNGPYGFIQNINFLIIGFTFATVGFGLGKHVYGKLINPFSLIFFTLSLGMIFLIIFPSDLIPGSNNYQVGWSGIMHFVSSFITAFLSSLSFVFVLQVLQKHKYWQDVTFLTKAILIFNTVFVSIWFALLFFIGLQLPFKGIFQKVLVFNVLLWLTVIGIKLWQVDSKSKV